MPRVYHLVAPAALLLVTGAALLSIGDADSPDAIDVSTAAPAAARGAACADWDAGRLRGRRVAGDVDADGRRDLVFVTANDVARCAWLVVRLSNGRTRSLRVPNMSGKSEQGALHPRVAFLRNIDTRAGAEVVVAMYAGASSAFLSVYSNLPKRLMRLGPTREYGDTFTVFGSVAHFGFVDCVGPLGAGRIAATTGAFPAPTRKRVSRTVMAVRGARLRVIAQRQYDLPGAEQPFPEMRSAKGPFGRCPRT